MVHIFHVVNKGKAMIAKRIKRNRVGIVKVVIVVALAALVGAAFLFMTQEQKARAGSQQIYDTLAGALDKSWTIDEVHEHLEREPNQTRTPSKKRLVEEYAFKGPLESHTVYAYYSVAATQILEAVSMGQKLPDWETE